MESWVDSPGGFSNDCTKKNKSGVRKSVQKWVTVREGLRGTCIPEEVLPPWVLAKSSAISEESRSECAAAAPALALSPEEGAVQTEAQRREGQCRPRSKPASGKKECPEELPRLRGSGGGWWRPQGRGWAPRSWRACPRTGRSSWTPVAPPPPPRTGARRVSPRVLSFGVKVTKISLRCLVTLFAARLARDRVMKAFP